MIITCIMLFIIMIFWIRIGGIILKKIDVSMNSKDKFLNIIFFDITIPFMLLADLIENLFHIGIISLLFVITCLLYDAVYWFADKNAKNLEKIIAAIGIGIGIIMFTLLFYMK